MLDRAHSLDDVPRLTLPDVSPRAYRRLTFIALVFLAAIIVTGALVRLTDSGLGCTDWPNCERGTLIRVSNGHQAVEQINRLFTGAMMIAVTVAVLASLRLVPRRRDLTWLSVSLVVGVLGQAVVGGVVVLTHLHPAAVVWHFLLSVVVLTAALVLHRRAGETGPYERTVTPSTLRLTRAVVAVTGLAIVAGTVVTGAGPHSGHAANDPTKVRRFGIAISSAARIHSGLVLCAVALALVLARRVMRGADRRVLEEPVGQFLFACLFQGAIGYTQYFSGVPTPLVAIHVFGSVVVWITACRLLLACRRPVGATDGSVVARVVVGALGD